MTLLAVCDVCGLQRRYEADEELQPLPDGWITIDTEGQAVHFCSWKCCGTFVTEQIRVDDGGHAPGVLQDGTTPERMR